MGDKLNTNWRVGPRDWSGLWTTFVEGNYFAREWIEEVHHQKLDKNGKWIDAVYHKDATYRGPWRVRLKMYEDDVGFVDNQKGKGAPHKVRKSYLLTARSFGRAANKCPDAVHSWLESAKRDGTRTDFDIIVASTIVQYAMFGREVFG